MTCRDEWNWGQDVLLCGWLTLMFSFTLYPGEAVRQFTKITWNYKEVLSFWYSSKMEKFTSLPLGDNDWKLVHQIEGTYFRFRQLFRYCNSFTFQESIIVLIPSYNLPLKDFISYYLTTDSAVWQRKFKDQKFEN